MVECKCTDKDSYSVKRSLLEKVRRESAKQGKIGVIELDINGATCYVVPSEVIEIIADMNTQQET